jgi:PKHD-type hydroxylase
MLVQVPSALTPQQVENLLAAIDASPDWVDGNQTSGHQSAKAKDNEQLSETSRTAIEQGAIVQQLVERNPLVLSAALPARFYPPMFSRYRGGQTFGAHVDNAVRLHSDRVTRMRTDLSATLFLSDPASYDGGALVIEDTYGAHEIKFAAGDMILYPSSSLHQVTPVTRGVRKACVFWIQSLVRDDAQRTLLFDMDLAIRSLSKTVPDDPSIVSLTGAYHNLLRMWAEV